MAVVSAVTKILHVKGPEIPLIPLQNSTDVLEFCYVLVQLKISPQNGTCLNEKTGV